MRLIAVAVLMVLASGCYHATVDTGLHPSGQKLERKWAHGFLYGLVPPSDVETATRCPNGIAKVETRLSFLNQVASALTGGIYTPMSITVECAAGRTGSPPADAEMLSVAGDADAEEIAKAINDAARLSSERAQPVWISFD